MSETTTITRVAKGERKKQILDLHAKGMRPCEIAKELGIARAYVSQTVRLAHLRGEAANRPNIAWPMAVVEACQTSPKPATEPTWIKIGDRLVKAESIHEVWLNGGTWLMRQSGMCSTPLTGPEADALWAHFADPSRCVDLTPAVATTTPNP